MTVRQYYTKSDDRPVPGVLEVLDDDTQSVSYRCTVCSREFPKVVGCVQHARLASDEQHMAAREEQLLAELQSEPELGMEDDEDEDELMSEDGTLAIEAVTRLNLRYQQALSDIDQLEAKLARLRKLLDG